MSIVRRGRTAFQQLAAAAGWSAEGVLKAEMPRRQQILLLRVLGGKGMWEETRSPYLTWHHSCGSSGRMTSW